MSQVFLTHQEVNQVARELAVCIPAGSRIYGVPRGGIPVAYLLQNHVPHSTIAECPEDADVIVDDILDSGKTRERYNGKPFYALYGRESHPTASIGQHRSEWLVFPWEDSVEGSAEDICTRLLQFIGEDPTREGLRETPKRFLHAWKFWTKGYREDPAKIMKVFEDGGENYDELVLVKDIPIFSTCEHHLAVIIGTAHVGYIPDGKIIGLSKIARVVEIFARRLQVQERLTSQIADCLVEHLQPKGVGVVIQARHLCMESRGVERPGAATLTSALRGVLMEKAEARAEFFAMVNR